MKKNLILGLILIAFTTSAQVKDSTLRLSFGDLNYASAFERSAFNQLQLHNDPDLFKLALSVDGEMNDSLYSFIRKEFYHLLKEIGRSKKYARKAEKRVKYIFESLHDHYFSLYELNSGFSEIFEQSKFNCLTATVLYALAFDEFMMPYEIKVSRDHAFLVAYPESYAVVVETTNPVKGISGVIDPRQKEKFLENLRELKLVSESDFVSKSTEELFNEYYFKEEGINLRESIGYLYSNRAIRFLESYDFGKAYELLEKAYFLCPRKETAAMMLVCASSIVEKRDFEDALTFELLDIMPAFESFGISKKNIEQEYLGFLNEYMGNRNEMSYVDSIFNAFLVNIQDSLIRRNVCYAYNHEKARLLIMDYQMDAAVPYLRSAYHLKTGERQLENMIMEVLSSKYVAFEHEPEYLNDLIRKFEKDFPGLDNNPRFMDLRSTSFLLAMAYYFAMSDERDAEAFRKKFEEEEREISNAYIIHELIPRVYSFAAMHYYSLNKYSKARDILNKGLEYSPHSFELQSKLDALKR